MPAIAVVGANWGDEGKGKITDYLAAGAAAVVRGQGGANAGHTIVHDGGIFQLHLLPSGVFRPGVLNVLAAGTAVDVPMLRDELDALQKRGVATPRLAISPNAHVVLSAHRALDRLEEARRGAHAFGSTKRGMAPVYQDKAAKVGWQVGDLLDEGQWAARVEPFLAGKNALRAGLYGESPLNVEEILTELHGLAAMIRPWVEDPTPRLQAYLDAGRTVLLEGQLGALRDIDHGIYPYTTSSSTTAAYAAGSARIPLAAVSRVVAVTKAYASAVGAGPFVTELVGEDGERLRSLGGHRGEYGATTGRPRRVGWFDVVATRYGAGVQGATELALTNLDVLSAWSEIPIATAYRLHNGQTTTEFPRVPELARAVPVLATLPGWNDDIRGVRRYGDLPDAARRYVEAIERAVDVPIRLVSVGPHREATIEKP